MNIVVYHKDCWDGIVSAWLFSIAFPDAQFIPATYGDPIPKVTKADNVYIVDFSYTRPNMMVLNDMASSLLCLDHHKTARDQLIGLNFCMFNMEKSGARLAWEYLTDLRLLPKEMRLHCPDIVQYVEDRDLWRHELTNTKELNAFIQSHPKDFVSCGIIHKRFVNDPTGLLIEGDGCLRLKEHEIEFQAKRAVKIKFDGHDVLAVNATCYQSEVGNVLAEQVDTFALVYTINIEDGSMYCSLRSKDSGIDVSEVAKKFGGGGHRNAAGCSLNLQSWSVLCNKSVEPYLG